MTKTLHKRHRDTLSGLPGVKGELRAVRVRSVTDAVVLLRRREPVTTAGDSGALTVYWDDEGFAHCEFYRRRATLEVFQPKTHASIVAWLKKWWPLLGDLKRVSS